MSVQMVVGLRRWVSRSAIDWLARSATAIMYCFMLNACSSAPTEEDGRKVLQNLNGGPNVVEVTSFQKTDGQSKNAGVEAYEMSYSATLTWPKGLNAQCAKSLLNDGCNFISISNIRSPGESRSGQGKLYFEKTERGWRGQDSKVY